MIEMSLFRRLIHGAAFGSGFAVAFVVLAFAGLKLLPLLPHSEKSNFAELTTAERAQRASALYVVRYVDGADRKKNAFIDSIHVKNDSIRVPDATGDRIASEDFYSSGAFDRNGALVYLIGNPAKVAWAAYLYNDRLSMDGDMPLPTFIKLFEQAS